MVERALLEYWFEYRELIPQGEGITAIAVENGNSVDFIPAEGMSGAELDRQIQKLKERGQSYDIVPGNFDSGRATFEEQMRHLQHSPPC